MDNDKKHERGAPGASWQGAAPADWHSPTKHYLSDEFADDRQFAATLARGLEILHCFTARTTQLGNAELVARTGMPKATISRFTYTLVRLGYLRINRLNNKYQLGSAVLSLGYPLLASLNIRQIARPFMKELADHIRGSVSIGMRDRLSVVYLESSRSAAPMSHPPDVGLSYPIVRTAMGRALIAASSREDRTALLNEIKVRTPEDWNTFQGRIEESIQEFQERGFCVSYGDLRREIHAVAVPMRAMADGEILVFNCGVPAFMLSEGQLMNDIGPRLVSMVRSIEGAMGIY
ncbi:MAG: IclR family transcriptional regulator [Pseudomonas sp.]|uniref:IclR family transcriptional regulator n=1 Tax=Pseudomonas abieticivorans TaxID=2931382 RepID=UPI0020BD5976|nr:IclR family transcriptional regulator [Pseudomonas sp. PIA16]MDE1167716.1 IclR family transcriptional regulator [Pseudomonas sp.]